MNPQPKPESWQEIVDECLENVIEALGQCQKGTARQFILSAIERSHATQPQHSDQPPAKATDDKQEWWVEQTEDGDWSLGSGNRGFALFDERLVALDVRDRHNADLAAEREKVEHLKRELKLSNDALAPTQQELYDERQRREQEHQGRNVYIKRLRDALGLKVGDSLTQKASEIYQQLLECQKKLESYGEKHA
jgi:hypothetical protein